MNDVAERFIIALAWMIPKRIVYWCAVRMYVYGSTGDYSGQDTHSLSIVDALERWAKQYE